MKKSIIWIIAAAVILAISAFVFFFDSKKDMPDSSDGMLTSSSQDSLEQSSSEAKPKEDEINYRETDISLWMKASDSDDDITLKLSAIDTIPYGTAGCSLHMFSSASYMLELSKERVAAERLREYLSSMTAIQRDYFSFQWENIYETANSILKDPKGAKGFLDDAGREDFDISLYESSELNRLFSEGRKIMEDMGVKYEWKNFTDIEPFNVNS